MKVYVLQVLLLEGDRTITRGTYSSREKAEEAWVEQEQDWDGPNVEGHNIVVLTVD